MSKPKQYKRLDHETIREITDCVLDKFSEERDRDKKNTYDKRLRNTKLLLQNYRDFEAHSDYALYEAEQIQDEDVYDILDMLSGNTNNETYVESIKKSAIRTRIIIEHVKEMVALYKVYCERSKKPEDMRRYRTVSRYYLADEPWTADEIAEDENVDKSTVYKDLKDATKRLSILIFGIAGLYR